MENLKAVLWDLDGVLMDTSELHYQTWREILQAQGVDLTREVFTDIFGMKNPEIMEKFFGRKVPPDIAEAVSERKERRFRELCPGRVELLPGVREWLERFQRRGWLQAVASSAPQENVDVLIDLPGIRPFFAAVVSADGLPGKPDPAVFLRAAELLQVPPQACLVVEDAVVGVEAARQAGCRCLAVTTSNPAEALSAADWVVARLNLLPEDFLL